VKSRITLLLVLCGLTGLSWSNDPPDLAVQFADSHNDLPRIEILVRQYQQRGQNVPRLRGALSPVTRLAGRNTTLAKENAALRRGPQVLRYADLASRLGQQITITTFESKRHTGTINSVDPGGVSLLISQRGGSASFRIRKDRIREIEGL